MPADMPVKPLETFPKEFHVCRETHMALVASGICHAHVKVIKIWFPVCGQYLLKGFNVKTGCYLITDGADYLVVGYWERRVYHDSAEHLVMYVAVKMFHKMSVRKSGIGLQDHKCNLCGRTKYVPAPKTIFRQPHAFCHNFKREH